MKQIDFGSKSIWKNILGTALPMLLAQTCSLLYNIIDRVYIGRIPEVGTLALGAIGLCFPIITMILAFTNLYAGGGAPLFAMARGKHDLALAQKLMNLTFFLEWSTGLVLMLLGWLLGPFLLRLLGASEDSLSYALPYLNIYLLGTVFFMTSTGMNPFINAEGFPAAGMISVVIGALLNLILDPIFIFGLGPMPVLGIRGAAIATVISQAVSAIFVISFLRKCHAKEEIYLQGISFAELKKSGKDIANVLGLGASAFIMQVTNSLVQMACNAVLSRTGGDLYISVMTIVASVRQMLEVPVLALTEGTSPIISYNYGAKNPRNMKRAIQAMTLMAISYTAVIWLTIIFFPKFFIGIFSSDENLLLDAVPALHIYFFAFIFMALQYSGQTTFKALGYKKHAIFFSLLRKVFIVVPLTFALPYLFGLGVNGVFMAEPISNVIGGSASFLTMIFTIRKLLKKYSSHKAR